MSLPPPTPQYEALLRERARLSALARDGGWSASTFREVLARGNESPAVDELRARLRYEQPLLAPGDEFDQDLEEAVRAFQRRRGLHDDGVVGSATRRELDLSASALVRRIDVNLERLRWLPRDIGRTYVAVNIAAGRLNYVAEGEERFSTRVIVGAVTAETPTFASRIDAIVFNPVWNIPPSATAALMSRVRADADLLARERIVFQNGLYRQAPGATNPLGALKFEMTTVGNVYLHDTPRRDLFDRMNRTFSSGCIRLERAQDLAEILLHSNGWRREEVGRLIATGGTRRVRLAQPVPIVIFYQTAWVEEDGLHLAPDIYGWDAQLDSVLPRPE